MPPLVIAHRGASAYEPENTLRAFDLAIRQGAQMIELDLHVTSDNQVVVIHDPTLNHTTNLKGFVDRLTLDEIRRADAGRGERIPTLDETLDLTLGKVRLYLEIKDPRAALPVLRIIRDRRCQEQVMLASFDIELMRGLGEEVSDTELGLILGNATFHPLVRWREAFPWIAFKRVKHQVLCMQVELCYGYLASRARAHGKKLYVWTADKERQYARMTSIGVDGIVTNTPDRLISYLNQQSDN
ncbi:MAG TPA: glycerophosphodiester phosphodiesterase [Blastocatellia bacterium]|jgi:glycerophosphoryl diester phosphodiesterase|nr:glycerophosphodiester phosphodiesterase [Blastocatellia bacterium]